MKHLNNYQLCKNVWQVKGESKVVPVRAMKVSLGIRGTAPLNLRFKLEK
jgi:hypothetical protein